MLYNMVFNLTIAAISMQLDLAENPQDIFNLKM